MNKGKKIGIVGGGVSGLALGYYLSKLGFEVVIFEKDKKLGGLLSTFDVDESGKIKLEKYYHHSFTNDQHTLGLVKDLGIEYEMEWHRASMSVFLNNKFYSFVTPLDLLKFPGLSIISKIRLGFITAFLKIQKNCEKYKNIKASVWIEKYAGQQVWQTIWKPLFKGKFGRFYKEITLSWFCSRIRQRGHSANKEGEILGYPKRSYQYIIDKLEEKILSAGGQIYKETEVRKIEPIEENQFKLLTESDSEVFDIIISTIAPPLFAKLLPKKLSQFKEQLTAVKYIGNISTVIELKKPLTKYYWTNILDDEFPFRGIMEHTNFVPQDRYLGKNLVYLSHYTATDSDFFNLNEEELLSLYLPHLKKINPDVENLMTKYWIFKDKYTQPIITPEHPVDILTFKTPLDGLYFSSMAQIFPEDRGVDIAIRESKKLANLILSEKDKGKWNEEMYSCFSTGRLYENKNFLVRFIEEQRIKKVVELSQIRDSDKVIEIGCEAGYLLKQLPEAEEVVGLDIAENALEDARKNVKSDKVKFICADGANIPLPDNYFDKVICSQTLEHADNPEDIVAEIHRLIKPGGKVIISVPYEGIVSGVKKFFVKIGLFGLFFPNLEPHTSVWHIQSFNKKTICQLLNKYFEVRSFRYIPIPFIGPDMIIECSLRSK